MNQTKMEDQNLEALIDEREVKKSTIVIPIIIYCLLSVVVTIASRSREVIMLGDTRLPVSAFSGVFTAIANICLIMMVMLYKKTGFMISLVMILVQLPILIMGFVKTHSLNSLPGLFLMMTTIGTIIIIYMNQKRLSSEQMRLHSLFEQTATALVNAIDAKDKYTHGHSSRVAEYSRRLAEMAGKSEKECAQVYYAALLHDVGKIGIPVSIINKKGKLTGEEYETIKQHPGLGAQILEKITEYPFLYIGARHHHERYEGQGYPDGLRGDAIPEIARIISVADAYDAMTSKRSYRDPIPQHKVREEIVKGTGTQFDPEYANYMLHLIDLDTEYEMKEREGIGENEETEKLVVGEYRSAASDGILINPCKTTIRMSVGSDEEAMGLRPEPSIILFDALDGCIHSNEKEKKELLYYEYGEIGFDGHTRTEGARMMQTTISDKGAVGINKNGEFKVEAVRRKDHAMIRILGKRQTVEIIIALPDSTRYLYISFSGKHCSFEGLEVEKTDEECPVEYIPRIADEVSYIEGPEGDIPNVQVDDYRTAHSNGVPIKNGMKILFHAKSLPTARLVWHCPFVVLFYSEDGKVGGHGYREYSLVRLDGETYGQDDSTQNTIVTKMKEDFRGWDVWKERNKEGYECEVTVQMDSNRVVLHSENFGVEIEATTIFESEPDKIYAAFTGDQVALTDIRIQ